MSLSSTSASHPAVRRQTIADALRRLLEEPALLSRCQAAAAALFAERFSYERIVDGLERSVLTAVKLRGEAEN